MYDPAGRLLRVIGRQGSGPGELEAPTRFGLIGDTLWVYDLRNQRITLFRATGELIATVPTTGVTVPVEMPGVTARVVPHEPRADGRFSSRLAVSTAGGAELTDTFSVAALVFDATGAVVDSAGRHVHTPRPPGGVTVGALTLAVQNLLLDTPLHYAHGADSVRIDRTVATSAAASAFVVTRRDASGDTVFSHRFRYLPRPVDAGFADAQVAPIMQMVAQFPVDPSEVEKAVRGALSLPGWHPPVSSYRSGADGSLWLRREDGGGDAWRWIVLRPDGTPRGVLSLPRRASVQWVSGEQAWVVVPDEFDVPWLVRYRID